MPKYQPITGNRLYLFQVVILIAFCCYFAVRQGNVTFESLVLWPGAYFLSLSIIGPLVLHQFGSSLLYPKKKRLFRRLWGSLFFGALHLFLSFFLIVLLERFLRLPEHFHFSDFPKFVFDSWWYVSDGVLWYWGYTAAFSLTYLYQRLKAEKEKTARAIAEAAQSQLYTLRSELNPHFLYNAMNSIAMKVRLKENKEAVSMIAALNDLLRVVLSKREEKMVSLSEEVDILDKYISIEKIRFGDKVSIRREFPEELRNARVPQLLLQPIVENAFKHGIRDGLSRQEICIDARAGEGWLVFTVFNTAKNHQRVITPINSHGIGIGNVLQRLKRIYGTHFQFQTEWVSEGIIFKISIPFQTI